MKILKGRQGGNLTKLKPEDIKLLKEIIATPLDQLINDHKAHCQFQDMLWEEKLEVMINDYKKWSRKSLNKPDRELYMSIIGILEKELGNGRKDNTNRRGTLGRYTLGYKQENGQTRDRDNNPAQSVQKVIRTTSEGVSCAGGKTIAGKIRYRLTNSL